MGYVCPEPLKKAFGSDAKFFVLNPPNDTRYLVLQRALASIGVCYEYHMRAVSCEAFAMTMMNADLNWNSLQLQVLNNTTKMTKEKRQKDAARFKEFYDRYCFILTFFMFL